MNIDLKNLSRPDAFQLARTCHSWYQLYQSPVLWRHLHLSFFNSPQDETKLVVVAKYGHLVQSLLIELDQANSENRRLAVSAIDSFTRLLSRQLEKFVVKFSGENPLFYGGQEFNLALHRLFGAPPAGTVLMNQLRWVDLEQMPIMYTDEILYALSANHSQLRYLNIQNKQLVCKISIECIRAVVNRCRNLEDLRLFHSSLADEILMDLANGNRAFLRHLSIFCRRQDKFTPDLSEFAWKQLMDMVPGVEVTLKFDHTCPQPIMSAIMKPIIPVTRLIFETYTKVVAKLKLAHRYTNTLKSLVIQSQPSRDFEITLLHLVESSPNLQSLEVTCGITEETIERLFVVGTSLIRSECQLNSDMSEQPWIGDGVWDEIRDDWK